MVVPVCDRGCFGLWGPLQSGPPGSGRIAPPPRAARERVWSRGRRAAAHLSFLSVFPEWRVWPVVGVLASVLKLAAVSSEAGAGPGGGQEGPCLLVSETPAADSGREACEIRRRFCPYPRLPTLPGRASGPSPQTAFMT